MNPTKKKAMIQRYSLPEDRLRRAYYNLFHGVGTPEDAKIVLMDLIVVMEVFDKSHRPGESPEYSVGFGDGKKAATFRILEFSGFEDQWLRVIDENWSY